MNRELRTAAVLLPVFRDAERELRVVLVVRADDGGQHGGQLGLPGGKPEPADAFPSGPTIDEMVRGLLRPMLKDWLDANLPAIVEAQVRKEVERIARNAG